MTPQIRIRVPCEASDAIVEAALQLLSEGLGPRTIARQLSERFARPVSKDLIYRLRNGKHVSQRGGGPSKVRCTGCGGKVKRLPCRACEVRASLGAA